MSAEQTSILCFLTFRTKPIINYPYLFTLHIIVVVIVYGSFEYSACFKSVRVRICKFEANTQNKRIYLILIIYPMYHLTLSVCHKYMSIIRENIIPRIIILLKYELSSKIACLDSNFLLLKSYLFSDYFKL